MPHHLFFFQRSFPSANMLVLRGLYPIIFDAGFGSDVQATEQLLLSKGIQPEKIQCIVNSHYHGDHCGANHYFQTRYGVQIAAHEHEAKLINERDSAACAAEWLDQPIEAYRVDIPLQAGDKLKTGIETWEVLHTAGHTRGHISLYGTTTKTLIVGDVFHGDDVAWLNPFSEGADSIYHILETLHQLAKLDIHSAYSGHGEAIVNPPLAIETARQRYEKWLKEPEKVAWHAMKRIFTYALMLFDGMTEAEISAYLLARQWFQDYSTFTFFTEPTAFVAPFLAEILRSGAAKWENDKLIPTAAYIAPDKTWLRSVPKPQNWDK